MRKTLIILGIIGITFLMFSTATAVPVTNSKVINDKLETVENAKTLMNKIKSLPLVKSIIGTIFGYLTWPLALVVFGSIGTVMMAICMILAVIGLILSPWLVVFGLWPSLFEAWLLLLMYSSLPFDAIIYWPTICCIIGDILYLV